MILKMKQELQKQISSKKELAEYMMGCIDETKRMTEEEREKLDAQIQAKLKAGKKLSQKEMDYLRKTNPIMYAHAKRVQTMAESMEERLKHAKSKEEADHIISSSLGRISKNDPDKEYIVASINRISMEFRKSGAYGRLPNTEKETKKKPRRCNGAVFSEAEEDKKGIDLNSWSPLTEALDNMSKFSKVI